MPRSRYKAEQFIEVPYGTFGTQVAQIERVRSDGNLIIRRWRDNSQQWTTATVLYRPKPKTKILTGRDPRVRRARAVSKPLPTKDDDGIDDDDT